MHVCRTTNLSNGLRVVAVEMPYLHSAEIAVYLKAGGRNDPPSKAGLSHFLEHMLFRGTAEHPTSLELETAFEAIGGSVNAATDEESTCYFSRVHPDHIAEGIALFSSMLMRPSLLGLDIEKRIITEEALEDLNEQGEDINTHNLASMMLWPDHPLGAPTIGYLDTINGFTPDDLRSHMDRFYVPANAVIVVAGAVAAHNVFAACQKAFSSWGGPTPPATLPVRSRQIAPRSTFVVDADSQVHLQLAFRGFSRQDHRIMPLRLMRRMLCGSGSSRLHLSLREQLGIIYSVDASISAYEETGAFAIELSTSPENLPLAVEEVLRAATLLATETPSAAELEKVRQCYYFDLEYSRDSTYEMQVRYGWGALMDMVRTVEEDAAEAAGVDAKLVRTVAGELFSPKNLNLVAVGSWTDAIRSRVEGLLVDYERKYPQFLP
jgi:predicted Zn-dependent peptidase